MTHTDDRPSGIVDYNGVKLRRYRISKDALASADINPDNCAYSNYGPTGVLNMTALVGSTVFASKPYFLDADPSYLDNITGFWDNSGMDPDSGGVERHRDLYDTVIDVNAITGSTFRAHQRLQINVLAEPAEGLDDFDGIRGFYMPVLYVDEWFQVPSKLTDKYKGMVGYVPTWPRGLPRLIRALSRLRASVQQCVLACVYY